MPTTSEPKARSTERTPNVVVERKSEFLSIVLFEVTPASVGLWQVVSLWNELVVPDGFVDALVLGRAEEACRKAIAK
jgi:hypothetical protein